MATIERGEIVATRYRLEHLLGEGGMGQVWAATHTVTRKAVALKILKSTGAANPDLLRRFLREARAASAVRHPNVVQIHDIVQMEDGVPIMVMDLLEGESLGQRLAREGYLSLPELAKVLVPVLSAIGTAHALGIVHRDLKPDNIFLERTPTGTTVPKVLDFGIAKLSATEGDAAETNALTKTGSMLGTPYYMSPEQAFGERDVDARSDVWAVGIILYECLTGRRPVDGDNFGQILKVITTGGIVPLRGVMPALPEEILTLADAMLTVDRKQRRASLHDAYDALRAYTDAAATSFPRVMHDPMAATQDAASLDTSADTIVAPSGTTSAEGLVGPRTARGITGGDAFAHTTLASARPPSTNLTSNLRRWVVAPVVVSALAVGAFFALRGGAHVVPPPSPTSSVSALPIPAASASEAPVLEDAPPAANTSPPARASARIAPNSPAGKPSVPSSEPAPKAPPPKPKLPGNMPEAAPF